MAKHQRSFLKNQKFENPLHREKLIDITPSFKYQRIHQLMISMDDALALFLKRAQGEGEDPLAASYTFFKLLNGISRHTLLSAVREANKLGTFKVAYVKSLLQPSSAKEHPVYPENSNLLRI